MFGDSFSKGIWGQFFETQLLLGKAGGASKPDIPNFPMAKNNNTAVKDVEKAEKELQVKLQNLVNQLQEQYPDSHAGNWWAPARLGGTAPTPEQVKLAAQKRDEEGE